MYVLCRSSQSSAEDCWNLAQCTCTYWAHLSKKSMWTYHISENDLVFLRSNLSPPRLEILCQKVRIFTTKVQIPLARLQQKQVADKPRRVSCRRVETVLVPVARVGTNSNIQQWLVNCRKHPLQAAKLKTSRNRMKKHSTNFLEVELMEFVIILSLFVSLCLMQVYHICRRVFVSLCVCAILLLF